MSRGYWNCGQNGHSSQTCPNGDFKLSGIRVGLFRRSLSMDHLSHHNLRLSPEKSDYGDGYLSEDLECGRRPREGDRRAILKKFPVSSNMPSELASYGRGSHFTRETRKEKRSNLFDIVEDEDNFDANAMPLLPPTECNHIRDGTNQKNSNTGEEDAESSIGSTAGTEYYSCIVELDNDNNGVNEAHQRTSDYYKRVTLKWIFVISNFVFEILTALFEQLSSPHQSHHALIGMAMSFAATIICVIEIVYKCRQQKVTWRIRDKIYWFYHPPPSHERFGTFKDIFGLVCVILQSISGVIMKWFLVVGNVSFEVLTAIFDQLTSPHRSLFALFAMVTSFFVIGFCLI